MTDDGDGTGLAAFGIDPHRGFLSGTPPLTSFGEDAHPYLRRLDSIGRELSRLLEDGTLGSRLEALGGLPDGVVNGLTGRELRRFYSLCGFFASAYVHRDDDGSAVRTLPRTVAVPLYESSRMLSRKPVLSYDSYILHNWTRADPEKGMVPENIRPITTFVAEPDETWFVAIHVAIESAAGPAIAAIEALREGIREERWATVVEALDTIRDALREVRSVITRMVERNEVDVFNDRFRRYFGPYQDVRYEGVSELRGPQHFRGASGAQTALFAALDAMLSVDYGELRPRHRAAVRDFHGYMPQSHRSFVEWIREGPTPRSHIAAHPDEALRGAYNGCVREMADLRRDHIRMVMRYLVNPEDSDTVDRVGDVLRDPDRLEPSAEETRSTGTGETRWDEFLPDLIRITAATRIERS